MSIASFCDVMALVRKEPRTARDIGDITGFDRKSIYDYMKALHAEGHVRIVAYRQGQGKPAAVYAWQAELFGEPDAEKPEKVGVPPQPAIAPA